jgi:hypothetical protein
MDAAVPIDTIDASDATTPIKAASPVDAAVDAMPAVEPPTDVPITLTSGWNDPRRVAVAGRFAYFTVYEDAVLARVPLDGGATDTLATGLEEPARSRSRMATSTSRPIIRKA